MSTFQIVAGDKVTFKGKEYTVAHNVTLDDGHEQKVTETGEVGTFDSKTGKPVNEAKTTKTVSKKTK